MPKQISNVRVRRVDLVGNPAVGGKNAGVLFVKCARHPPVNHVDIERLTKEDMTTIVRESIKEAFAIAKGDRNHD